MSPANIALGGIDARESTLARRLEAAARAAVEAGPGTADSIEISITLVDEEAMRRLNRRYHGVDAPTDVLAFDLGPGPGEGPSQIGDIYVCRDVARRQAAGEGVEVAEELARLVIHGVLHLRGYDHPEGEMRYASPMFELQERILRSL